MNCRVHDRNIYGPNKRNPKTFATPRNNRVKCYKCNNNRHIAKWCREKILETRRNMNMNKKNQKD